MLGFIKFVIRLDVQKHITFLNAMLLLRNEQANLGINLDQYRQIAKKRFSREEKDKIVVKKSPADSEKEESKQVGYAHSTHAKNWEDGHSEAEAWQKSIPHSLLYTSVLNSEVTGNVRSDVNWEDVFLFEDPVVSEWNSEFERFCNRYNNSHNPHLQAEKEKVKKLEINTDFLTDLLVFLLQQKVKCEGFDIKLLQKNVNRLSQAYEDAGMHLGSSMGDYIFTLLKGALKKFASLDKSFEFTKKEIPMLAMVQLMLTDDAIEDRRQRESKAVIKLFPEKTQKIYDVHIALNNGKELGCIKCLTRLAEENQHYLDYLRKFITNLLVERAPDYYKKIFATHGEKFFTGLIDALNFAEEKEGESLRSICKREPALLYALMNYQYTQMLRACIFDKSKTANARLLRLYDLWELISIGGISPSAQKQSEEWIDAVIHQEKPRLVDVESFAQGDEPTPRQVFMANTKTLLDGILHLARQKRALSDESHLKILTRLRFATCIVTPAVARSQVLVSAGILSSPRLIPQPPKGPPPFYALKDYKGPIPVSPEEAAVLEEGLKNHKKLLKLL